MDALDDLSALVFKYKDEGVDFVKMFKKLTNDKKSKHGKMDELLDKAAAEVPLLSQSAFKSAANRAWQRAHPDAKRPCTKYQEFMKANLPRIREDNPGLKHTAYMGLVAKDWREHQAQTHTSTNKHGKKHTN